MNKLETLTKEQEMYIPILRGMLDYMFYKCESIDKEKANVQD